MNLTFWNLLQLYIEQRFILWQVRTMTEIVPARKGNKREKFLLLLVCAAYFGPVVLTSKFNFTHVNFSYLLTINLLCLPHFQVNGLLQS